MTHRELEVYLGRGLSNRVYHKITDEQITIWIDDLKVYDSEDPESKE